jgi:hypothetical protein
LKMNSNHSIDTYSSNSHKSFAVWSQRFQDFIDAFGNKMNEAEKVARLKLALDGHPRQVFDELTDEQKSTLANALKFLTAKIDSPQKREVARATIAAIRQEDGETIADFSERLRRLVDQAYSHMTFPARRERLCELFLEKMDQNVAFLVKLTGLQSDFETARTKAMEVEAMMAQRKKEPQLFAMQNNQNVEEEINSDESTFELSSEDFYCTFCRKQGHTIYECYSKPRNWQESDHQSSSQNHQANSIDIQELATLITKQLLDEMQKRKN